MRRTSVLVATVCLGVGLVGVMPAAAAPWVGPTAVVGSLDTVTSDGVSMTLTGWAAEPGASAPVRIHVYDNGPDGLVAYNQFSTGLSRPDVVKVIGGSTTTGYAINVPMSPGTHEVCAFGIGQRSQSLLGCATITTPPPFGVIDAYQDVASDADPTAEFLGWAVDPALRSASLAIHTYDYAPDGQVTAAAFASTVERPDVAAVFGSGPAQGFDVVAPLSATLGDHRVCVFAITATGGPNELLGCEIVTVYPAALGSLDVAVPAAVGGVGVAGWAIDPLDPTTSIPVGFTGTFGAVEGSGVIADQDRPDVAAAFPGVGANHGFISVQAVGLGESNVCAVVGDAQAEIGCGTVVMDNQIGSLDVAEAAAGSIDLSGWSLDPYLSADAGVTLLVVQIISADDTVEPQIVQVVTDEERADVNAALGVTGTHGFTLSVGDGALAPGQYVVNLWAPLLLAVNAESPGKGEPFLTATLTVS